MTPQDRYEILIDYLLMKADEGDWHGVRDAASDLELMEARNPDLKSLRKGATWNVSRKD